MSLNRIYTYRSDGGRTLLLGHTTDSDFGGVTEILARELKNIGSNSFFYRIFNCCLQAQYKALQKSVEQVYGAGDIGGGGGGYFHEIISHGFVDTGGTW